MSYELVLAIIVILGVATYCKFVLGWSTKDMMLTIISEFKDLLSGRYSAGGINAAVIIAVFLLSAAYLFFPKFEKVVNVSRAGVAESGDSGTLFGVILVLLVGGLVCVSLVRSER